MTKFSLALFAVLPSFAAASDRLSNGLITADFDRTGLTAIAVKGRPPLRVVEGTAAIEVDGKTIRTEGVPRIVRGNGVLTYAYPDLEVVYELRPTWSFVSKQIRFAGSSSRFTVGNVDGLAVTFPDGAKLRAAGGASATLIETATPQGYYVLQQNPFPVIDLKNGLRLGYVPKMEWRRDYGAFETDRICIGAYRILGHSLALPTVRESTYVADPAAALAASPQIDRGAYDAIRSCIDAFVIGPRPKKSLKVHIPWCENDYQIDLAKPDGPPQYERIIDQAKALGSDYVLFTPQNSNVSKRSDSNDAWAWESLLWLGYGPKIRKGEWDVQNGPIHPSVQSFLDYAKRRKVKLLTYVYPTLAWTQNKEWTAWAAAAKLPLGGYVGADTGNRGFQDWFVDTVVKFCARTGLAGVSFDHWWMAYDYPSATSKYAQWYGTRRILEELRRRKPDIVIDGRQQYHQFGAWTWLGGSYPHPTANDEQPASFHTTSDLHTDRVYGNHQRFASYWYTVRNFTPPILNPGFITHQTQRNTPTGFTTDDYRVKDWDVRGWRYSMLSSIATAPYNSTVNMIPARDTEEFRALSAEDKRWFIDWISWPDRHRDVIANTRPILGQPMPGKVDGASMISGDHGFLFLFNPDYRRLSASFTMDGAIGLDEGRSYVVRQVEPEARALGVWRRGEKVDLPVDGVTAMVLQIEPIKEVKPWTVLSGTGKASFSEGVLSLDGARGEVGTEREFWVAVSSAPVREARVNGSKVRFTVANGEARLSVRFAGDPFETAVVSATRDFSGTLVRGAFTIPARIKENLARAKAAWPVTYSEDDLLASWLGQDRLLLFIQIADANDKMPVTLKIDGQPFLLKKAYNSIVPESNPGTFIGYYADVGSLPTRVGHTIEVALPTNLAKGQFGGVFFDNVDKEYTHRVVAG